MAAGPSSVVASLTDDRSGLAWLDAAIHREILRLRAAYELSLDEFRGLYVSDEQVNRLVEERSIEAGVAEDLAARAETLRRSWRPNEELRHLQDDFALSDEETAAVLVAFAPELDLKYQTLFAYLNNDVTRKWPTVDLLLRLSGAAPEALGLEATLFAEGIFERIGSVSPHWRATGVGVAAPVREFLQSAGREAFLRESGDDPLAEAVRVGKLQTLVFETVFGGDPLEAAKRVAAQAGLPLVRLRKEPSDDLSKRLRETLLEARLRRGAAYFEPETFGLDSDASPASDLRHQLEKTLTARAVKFIAVDGRASWRGLFEHVDYETIRLQPRSSEELEGDWREALDHQGVEAESTDITAVSRLFALHRSQIDRAAAHIARRARRADVGVLSEAARRQCSTSLESLSTRVELSHSWEQLILPAATFRRLKEFASAIRHREKVFREWSFLRHAGGKAALIALFSGSSGTGKTMSAGVVARDLGLELYRIDLSSVVSKYIGETESNLERIFRAAEGSNAILFFDEADALFGKRSEIKDAHDRYANIEVAYLLQRMEAYDGVMILATNLAQNVDDAFSRRIHFDIEFPLPDEANRERLWRSLIPEEAPRSADIDYPFLAKQFAIAGGDIRNVALDAALLAAHENGEIGMNQLARALARQRKKQGKLPSPSEFKQYFDFVRAESGLDREAASNKGDNT